MRWVTLLGLSAVVALAVGCGESSSESNQPMQQMASELKKTATTAADAAKDAAQALVTPAAKDAVASNAKCPVGGEDVDPKAPKVVYNGKVYGFCCDECIPKFSTNPAKYVKAE